jgi:tRNA A37 threonylcarbamoyladenosine biosynthesis protein TsaE
LLHADTYRLEEGELEAIGIEEVVEQWPGVVLVEWADRFPGLLEEDHLEVRVLYEGSGRRIELRGRGPRHTALLERMQAIWEADREKR